MKKINIDKLNFLYLSKTIVIIGMLMTIFSLGLDIASVIPNKDYDSHFGLWIYSYIVALASLLFYIIDGIFCIIRAFYKLDMVFNVILGAVIFIGIPMIIFIGGRPIICIIWNIYYFAMLVLEIISIIRAIRHRKTLPETPLST